MFEERKKEYHQIFIMHVGNLSKQSSIYPPLGLAQIIASLEKEGYKLEVIDLLFDKTLERVENLKGKDGIYILSFSTALVDRVNNIIKIIRQKDKKAFIMGGGAHPTAMKEKVFEDLDLDLIALGEVKTNEIINALHRKNRFQKLSKIKGIIYKQKGKIKINPAVDSWEELDSLPIANQGAFPLDKYFKLKGFRELTMISSRGCPHRCIFCQPILRSLFGSKIRFASPKKVVDEMEYLVKNFKIDMITFSDDDFAFNQNRVIEICKELIRRKIHVLWRCQARVGIKEEVLKYMKRAGCFLIAFGVESGSQKILDDAKKDLKVQEIIDTLGHCKKIGILIHAYLMVGNIGESRETINKTILLIKKIKPFTFNISITTPYPGTFIYEYAKENNLFIDSKWSEYDHILNGAVAKLSDFEPEELYKIKEELEKVLNQESERYKDLMGLLLDIKFMSFLFWVIIQNPSLPFRMLRLTFGMLVKKGKAFVVTNPYLEK